MSENGASCRSAFLGILLCSRRSGRGLEYLVEIVFLEFVKVAADHADTTDVLRVDLSRQSGFSFFLNSMVIRCTNEIPRNNVSLQGISHG